MATTRSILDIERALCDAQVRLAQTEPARLHQQVADLQGELVAAKQAAVDQVEAEKADDARQHILFLQKVCAELKRERSSAVLQAGTSRRADDLELAFALDRQVVACESDLAQLRGDRPETQLGVSTVKADLSDLRGVPHLRGYFFQNPMQARQPLDKSRWAWPRP